MAESSSVNNQSFLDNKGFLDYLTKLGYDGSDKSKPFGFDKIPSPECVGAGTTQFVESLHLQDSKHKEDAEEAKLVLMRLLQTSLLEKYGIRPEINGFVKFVTTLVKDLNKIQAAKSDLKSSASTWTTERFNRHFSTLRMNFVPLAQVKQEDRIQPEIFTSIQQKFLELASVYLDAEVKDLELGQGSEFLEILVESEFKEATSRLFIDALITPILKANRMHVRLEENLYLNDLPKAIADYVIYNSDGDTIGVIEAKTGGKLKAESVMQCMLQLLALRTKAPHTLFGVVTDAVRYIFIVLTPGGVFQFERDPYALQSSYYDITSWADLHDVASIFTTMLLKKERDEEVEPQRRELTQ